MPVWLPPPPGFTILTLAQARVFQRSFLPFGYPCPFYPSATRTRGPAWPSGASVVEINAVNIYIAEPSSTLDKCLWDIQMFEAFQAANQRGARLISSTCNKEERVESISSRMGCLDVVDDVGARRGPNSRRVAAILS